MVIKRTKRQKYDSLSCNDPRNDDHDVSFVYLVMHSLQFGDQVDRRIIPTNFSLRSGRGFSGGSPTSRMFRGWGLLSIRRSWRR